MESTKQKTGIILSALGIIPLIKCLGFMFGDASLELDWWIINMYSIGSPLVLIIGILGILITLHIFDVINIPNGEKLTYLFTICYAGLTLIQVLGVYVYDILGAILALLLPISFTALIFAQYKGIYGKNKKIFAGFVCAAYILRIMYSAISLIAQYNLGAVHMVYLPFLLGIPISVFVFELTPTQELQKLMATYQSGQISDEEFNVKRREILNKI